VVHAVSNVLILSGSHFLKILTETDFELHVSIGYKRPIQKKE